jgi:hypothetical protein
MPTAKNTCLTTSNNKTTGTKRQFFVLLFSLSYTSLRSLHNRLWAHAQTDMSAYDSNSRHILKSAHNYLAWREETAVALRARGLASFAFNEQPLEEPTEF